MATVDCRRQRHGTSVTDTHIPSQGQLARVGCLASCVRVCVAEGRRGRLGSPLLGPRLRTLVGRSAGGGARGGGV